MGTSLAQEILQMRNPNPGYCQSHSDGIKSINLTMFQEDPSEKKAIIPQETSVKEVVKLTITKEDVGPFVGKGGNKIKDFVIDKTRSQVDDDTSLFCSIITKGTEAFARLKAADEGAMTKLKENLMTHQEHCQKMKKFAGQTRFVFKTNLKHFKIAKFIGRGGNNIRKLKEKIINQDPNLTEDRVFVQIKEDEKISMKNLRFGLLGNETCIESDDKVLITVSIYTDDRDKSWDIVSDLVKAIVDDLRQPSGGNRETELGDDEDPWNGDW
jgi:predicted RNA-binding protein YlqC (UPF0109 family)